MKKLLLLAVLCFASSAFAAERYACCAFEDTRYGLNTNTTRVEFYGGVALPEKSWRQDGDSLELGKTGFTAGIAFVRNVLPWLTLGMDGNYAGFAKSDEFAGNTTIRPGAATALVATRLYLFPHSMTRLYATGGLGAGYVYAREKGNSVSNTYDSTDVAWMLGAGLEFDIDETVVFGAEGRYNWTGLRSEMKDRFHKDNYDYWTIMLKLGVKF